jgi:ABC-2 type transport system ATP-binding protein
MNELSVLAPLTRLYHGVAPAVAATGLTKRFGSLEAVREASFAVYPGEVFAFLGPNGAGKSTTIRMLCTLTRPTGGRATVGGFDVIEAPEAVRHRIGLVSHDQTLEARRLEIARALLHAPDVLFMDEPTVGLDPQTRACMWEDVLRLREEEGTTVFFATHDPDEAGYADRIAIIDHGAIVALASPAGLKEAARRPTLDDVFFHFTGRPIRAEAADGPGGVRRIKKVRRR